MIYFLQIFCSFFGQITNKFDMLSCLVATVLEQGTAPAENSTVACCCTGELPGCIIVTVLCAAVCEEQLSWKRTKRAVKKKHSNHTDV